MRRLLSSGGAAAAAVVLAAAVGAGVGAAVRPAPANPYAADAVIAIQPDLPAAPDEVIRQRARWQRAAEALDLPQVLSRTAALAHQPVSVVRSRLSARGRPDAGLFMIHARGGNAQDAIGIASAATTSTIELLRASTGNAGAGSARAAFDFENGVQDWGRGHSVFLLPPSSTVATVGRGFTGRGFLRTTCRRTPPGCGTWVNISRAFSPARVYLATASVRATHGRVPLSLIFGSSPDDVAVGPKVQVSRGWTRIGVKWTPRSLVGSAEIDVQVNGRGPATFDTDQVAVRGPGGRVPQLQALDIPDRYTLVGPPQSSGKLRAETATAALVGGGIGLAAVAGGLACGWLARRRRHQGQQ